jgi:hypothetical protein
MPSSNGCTGDNSQPQSHEIMDKATFQVIVLVSTVSFCSTLIRYYPTCLNIGRWNKISYEYIL